MVKDSISHCSSFSTGSLKIMRKKHLFPLFTVCQCFKPHHFKKASILNSTKNVFKRPRNVQKSVTFIKKKA
jgi:hypothetical protein